MFELLLIKASFLQHIDKLKLNFKVLETDTAIER